MSMTRTTFIDCLLALAAIGGARHVATAAEATSTLAIAGRANATPSIAADGRFVVIAWSASARGMTDIYAAVSSDGGQTFGAAVRVNDVARSEEHTSELQSRLHLVCRLLL